MTKNLAYLAGKNAYRIIKEEGLQADSVKIIAGAAGGPKWLVLNRLDRYLFSGFFANRSKPLHLIGSSIGAWRFSALCQKDPLEAQQRFEEAYIHQHYTSKPSPAEISEESRKILDHFISESGIQQILNHAIYRLAFLAVRCKWPSSSDSKLLLGGGLLLAALSNIIKRSNLKLQFERVLFHGENSSVPYQFDQTLKTRRVPLSVENYKSALISSGSIPLVMEGVQQIPGAPQGTYRDGGLIDYHMDLPYRVEEDEIVLFPHFSDRIVPGWLDKQLKWRKPGRENMNNVLLVAPSKSYTNQLPNQKIPDRNDFWLYKGRDEDRFNDWKTVVNKGELLATEFENDVASGQIKQLVQPLEDVV